MKAILILTDFSNNATHAALAGITLAKKMHANILLFHSNTKQALTPVYAGGPTVVDEVNLMADENKKKLKELAGKLQPLIEAGDDSWQPSVHCHEGLGALWYQVKNIVAERDIEIIVMGAREGSRLDHFFGGSETFSVIDHVSRPVLVMPYDANLDNVKRVAFATNFAGNDMKAISYLAGLASVFNSQIEIVHINSYGDDNVARELGKMEFMRHVQGLGLGQLNIQELRGKDVINRLSRLYLETKPDLFAFTHYRDSFFSRLFHQSTAREALVNQKVPMLIFPARFLV